jgi:hypothetical protein
MARDYPIRTEQRKVEHLRLVIETALLQRASEALSTGDLTAFDNLTSRSSRLQGVHPASLDSLTPHERFLDKCRVYLTGGLLAALFGVVGVILFTKAAASTATPYVSLLSGLAGIALGWMFTSTRTSKGAGSSNQDPNTSNDS